MSAGEKAGVRHEKTWACDFWRPCCCHHAGDGHCWGCGAPKDDHANGEGFPAPPATPTPGGKP